MKFIRKDSLIKLDKPLKFARYKVEKVTAEINDGFIENIKAYLNFGGETRYFTIPYPIGITSVANFKSYASRELFDMSSPIRMKRLSKKEIKSYKNSARIMKDDLYMIDSVFFIYLDDLIDYDYELV
jgi:hypothetical protein